MARQKCLKNIDYHCYFIIITIYMCNENKSQVSNVVSWASTMVDTKQINVLSGYS